MVESRHNIVSIALAQSASVKGDIEANINHHLKFVEIAAKEKADLIVFPELSLSGYEPELAKDIAITPDDKKLFPLREASQKNNIIISVGAPIKSDDNSIKIGLICFHPDRSVYLQTKRYLHPGEENYFYPGKNLHFINLYDERIGFAICADISNPAHPEKAVWSGASIYIASVLVTEKGYSADCNTLIEYAKEHNMITMMVNHSGITGGFEPAGKSAAWDSYGKVIYQLRGKDESIILLEKTENTWKAKEVDFT